MMTNPYQKYQQQSVMTMTQGEMLKKLYDGVIKELSGAVVYIDQKDYVHTNMSLQKAQRILNHLKVTLNFKYEVSSNLSSLYDYFISQIVQANMKKDPKLLEEIIPMVAELRDAFVQADKNARTK